MTSREAILRAVRENRPAMGSGSDATPPPAVAPPPEADPLPDANPLPEVGEPHPTTDDLLARFTRSVQEVGGTVLDAGPAGVAHAVRTRYPDATRIASLVPEQLAGSLELATIDDPRQLADLDLLVTRAELGVAENGAVWLPESRLGHRAAPFITQHLAVLLERDRIVEDMAGAYASLRVDEEGYGVFIAGPSKTADIEQSLVIGAHGPRSLTLVLV